MEMVEEDRPPEEIWLNDAAIEDHFERLSERHRQRHDDNGSGDWEEIPDLEQNALTKGLR